MPSVLSVYCTNGTGYYAPGDTLHLSVVFTQPVMVTPYPPVLRMHTAATATSGGGKNGTITTILNGLPHTTTPTNRSALYISGNHTNILTFAYQVQIGDMAIPLDYIDTRYFPFDMQGSLTYSPSSWALNTDVEMYNFDRFFYSTSSTNPRSDDIVLQATMFGGIFRSTTTTIASGPTPPLFESPPLPLL